MIATAVLTSRLGVSLPTAAVPGRPVRVNGMVVRTSDADDSPDRFRAVCAVCPHEQGEVDLSESGGTRNRKVAIGRAQRSSITRHL